MKFPPKKSLGQNFLLNKVIIKNIVELAQITEDSTIIEIGPGTGNLTEEIIKKKPKNFFAIEKDKNLCVELNKKFNSGIEIINEDILNVNWDKFSSYSLIIFGNLPYNISSKILINLIQLNNVKKRFNKLILMFQKEVADRLIAKVNSSKYGRLTILTEWKFNTKKVFDINPENFYPAPKVKSSLICLEPKNNIFKFSNPKSLEKVTNIFFQNRRKMIKKSINILFKENKSIIKKLNLDEKFRPQNLLPSKYFEIAKIYEDRIC